jgi:hypothetical protein
VVAEEVSTTTVVNLAFTPEMVARVAVETAEAVALFAQPQQALLITELVVVEQVGDEFQVHIFQASLEAQD